MSPVVSEIAKLADQGLTAREIAARLGISKASAQGHRYRIRNPRPSRGGVRRGEAHHMTSLTADDVRKMRALRAAGDKLEYLAELFGVSQQSVGAICQRKTWKHVE